MPDKPAKLAFQTKGKPRGRPLPKGHKIGHRFKPGESGNPGGLSKLKCLTKELNAKLPRLAPDLVDNLLRRALENSRDLETVWDRAEGPLQRNGDSSSGGGIKVLILNQGYRPMRVRENGDANSSGSEV